MILAKFLTCTLAFVGVALPPAVAGQLTYVDAPSEFGTPPAIISVYNRYEADFKLADNGPVDVVFTVAATGSAVDYSVFIDLKAPPSVHALVGLELQVGFGTGDEFVTADWQALKITHPVLNFVDPSSRQNNYATWSPTLDIVFNEEDAIVTLFYMLSIPDPDAAFIPTSHRLHEAGELTGYNFTIRHTPIFVPEPATGWLVLGLAGLAASRPSGRRRRALRSQ